MTPPLIGIDLGTTNSLVAVLQDGKPVVLPNAIGEVLTPSAVFLSENGEVLVGAAARANALLEPEAGALAFKREMGTEKTYSLRDKQMTPVELSALVLGALKRDAEAALGHAVEEAVVTVPAYFGDLQRQATRDAGQMAGLKVERILNEPTAAALAYGLHQRGRESRVAVLDLGGGTFDVTLLEIIEGVIEIQSSAGDARLGGEDFDDAIADVLAERLRSKGHDARAHARAWARLRAASEGARRRLSTEETTRILLPELAIGSKRVTVNERLSRDEAERAFRPLLERLRGPIARALNDASLKPDQIDEVLLVGGATRMPCVASVAAEAFGRLPCLSAA